MYTLKELCKRVGASRRSIQCYEKAGLMGPQSRNKYGHLLYDETSLKQAEHIRYLQRIGFSLKEISLMNGSDDRMFIDSIRSRLEILRLKRSELDDLIRATETYLQELENTITDNAEAKEEQEK